jgi:copper(I)-binding protein
MRYPRAHHRIAVGFVAVLTAAALAACDSAASDNSTSAPPAKPTGSPVVLTGITANSPDHSVALQHLFIEKPGAAGYPKGSSAKLSMDVWNNTSGQVAMTSASAAGGAKVVFVDGSSPSASTFTLALPPNGFLPLQPKIGRYVEVRCLPRALAAGGTVKVTFHFDNGASVVADVPVDASADGAASTASPTTC